MFLLLRLIERLEAKNPAAAAAAQAAQLAIGPWHLLPHKARQVYFCRRLCINHLILTPSTYLCIEFSQVQLLHIKIEGSRLDYTLLNRASP